MNPRFAMEREKNNKIFYKEYVNDQCYPHFHSQIELYFILDGEMDIVVNSHYKRLKKGEVAVSLSYDTHQYKTNEYSKSAVFIIPIHMAGDFGLMVKKKTASIPFISDEGSVTFILDCIDKINNGNLLELEIKGYAQLILGNIYKNISFDKSDKHICTNLSSKILFYIEENFMDDISLEKLSSDLGYSPFYISHYFKNCFQMGFNNYLNIIRVRNFVKILADNDFNITYCAYESGFNSIRTLYRVFYKEFSMSPKEYIKYYENI